MEVGMGTTLVHHIFSRKGLETRAIPSAMAAPPHTSVITRAAI